MAGLLEQVNSPRDLKKLKSSQLVEYAAEVRDYITATVMRQGGHLSSNLGAVELTIALHYVFDSPRDKIIFDVGHQSYTHKIITGRRAAFSLLRSDEGISGFPSPFESEHDPCTSGHSSTSLSVGLGYVRARDLKAESYDVVSVIGDGAFTGGMALEALNDIGAKHERMIIVLNDNKMSISRNVGAFSEYLARLRLSRRYASAKRNIKRSLEMLPFFGDKFIELLDRAKESVKFSLIRDKIFENLGVKYYGPIDGHDIPALVDIFRRAKSATGPILLHVVTKKGNGGDEEVVKNPDKFHGVGKADAPRGHSYAAVAGKKLCELARLDDRITAVTAAMAMGTGLTEFAAEFPERYFDVGIAEEHATAMCAGLAAAGMKPFFAVYSSFLQRGFDQIMHDVCLDRRHVAFLIDHAGAVDGDGVTHQGIYDIAYLSMIPGMTILQPRGGAELERMIEFAAGFDGPIAVRYEKSFACELGEPTPMTELDWEVLRKESSPRAIVLAAGNRMLSLALELEGCTVINARVIKPLDEKFLSSIESGATVITLEDGVLRGGFGESVRAFFAAKNKDVSVFAFGFPDEFIRSTSLASMYAAAGLTKENISKTALLPRAKS